MTKWAFEGGAEIVSVPIDPKRYKEILAEIAELLYSFCSQLDPRNISSSQSVGPDPHTKDLGNTTKEVRS